MRVRACLRFKNEAFYQARLAAGLSQAELAAELGCTTATVNGWENFRGFPHLKSVRASDLERILCTPLSDLFPSEYREAVRQKQGRAVQAVAEVTMLPPFETLLLPSTEDLFVKEETERRLHDLLKLLTPKEYEVIARRFGLAEFDEATLEDVGWKMQLSRERIRQLETQAIKKLKRATFWKRSQWLTK